MADKRREYSSLFVLVDETVTEGGNSGGLDRNNFCCRPPSVTENKNAPNKADIPPIEQQLRDAGDIDENGIFVVEYQLPEGSNYVPDAYIDGQMMYWPSEKARKEGEDGLLLCNDWTSAAQACLAPRKKCCAPYTKKINVNTDVPGSGTLVADAPPEGKGVVGEYNPGDFMIPSDAFVVPSTYSSAIAPDGSESDPLYRYENGDACEYGTPVNACLKKEVEETFVPPALDDANKTTCTDPDATNTDKDTGEACEFNQCCKYAKDSDLVVECTSSEANQLEIDIATLNAEIQVLERQRDRYENQKTSSTNTTTLDFTGRLGSNPDAQIYSSTQLDSFTNEGVYIKGTILNLTGNAEDDFNSFGGDSDFNDVNKWDAVINSDTGVVSFELNDVDAADDTFVLSQNSTEKSGANLYRQFCISKGYSYEYYKNVDGEIVVTDVSDADGNICIDRSYITCEAVTNVKMVFGANQWDGFYIPQDPDENGETEVNISLDIMVRFNADTLLNDCLEGGDSCGIPYVDLNGVYDNQCSNYVVFTNNVEDRDAFNQTKHEAVVTDTFTGQINWEYGAQQIEVWQTTPQLEPSDECCTKIGGTIESSDSYLNGGEIIPYTDSRFSNLTGTFSEYSNILLNNIKIVTNIKDTVDACSIQYQTYTYPGCESNYSDLITTTNICSLTPDDNLLGHTAIVQKYDEIINQLANIRDAIDICTAENIAIQSEIEELEIEEEELITKRNSSEDNLKGVYAKRTDDRETCNSNISRLTESYSLSTDETEAERIREEREDEIQKCEDLESGYGTSISQLQNEIKKYNECIQQTKDNIASLRSSLNNEDCCNENFRDNVQATLEGIVSDSNDVVTYTVNAYDEWKTSLLTQYNEGVATENGVYQFMENTTIDFTLEVDNNLGTPNNNRVTKYKTLNKYKQEGVWTFNPTGGYSGVLLEGSKASIDGVKLSVQETLGDDYSDEIFDAQWQTITVKLDEQDCRDLLECYPNKQFFIGVTINNEKNCETTLLVDNIKIDNNSYVIKNMYSLTNTPSFNLKHTIDDKKSWIFNDDLTKVQNRYRAGLEYRYSDYDVNHSKLVVNSKETSFRIDPANAVECDVYNFWQEVDCDECNTLFSCTTATTLTYTNPTGGTVSLTGGICPSFNFDGLISQIRSNYNDWKDALYNELNDSSLVRNMSYTVIDETKAKPKVSQKVSRDIYVNDLFKKENINNYGVSYFLPESLGVGFDTQTTQCSTNIIEIKNNDNTYTLLGEETDGTIGLYSFSADTNAVCEINGLTEQYCFKITEELNHTFKLEKDDYHWSNGKCRWKSEDRIGDDCDCGTSDYGTILKQSNVIVPGVTVSGETTLEELSGLSSDTDIFVFYDATSNSLANIRIQSAHIYRWWIHYIQGGVLVDLPEEGYTGKLRQYVVFGDSGLGERWLAWASYPWTGRFLSEDDGDNVTNHGFINKKLTYKDSTYNRIDPVTGNFAKRSEQVLNNDYRSSYDKVLVFDDSETNEFEPQEKSILEILYEPAGDNKWKDPITEVIYDKNDPYLITEIKGVHRRDEVIKINGQEYSTGGMAKELYEKTNQKGIFPSNFNNNYKVEDEDEINRSRVFMISMIDEVGGSSNVNTNYYHSNPTNKLTGDADDFYTNVGSSTSGFTQAYVDDFNKFIKIYQDGILGSGYTYFRGYNYSTFGSNKTNWPVETTLSIPGTTSQAPTRALFSLHSYAAIQGETVDIANFKEYPYPDDGGTLSAITHTNPYSALTATTLDGQNKAGLKHFGWAENHQVGVGNRFTPLQIPQDVDTLVETDSVLQYTIGPSGTTAPSLSATCAEVPICVNPLNYLDKQPSEVNIKPNFDEMVLGNLIDVKSRQVISGYPLLQMFYNQYLNSKGCGSSISNNLNVNTTFEVMDLIGDYWTDIIEQVVPATTIWDGHNNSGKVYRNTIFEQQKYPYRRYATNYFDGNECSIDGITQSAFAYTTDYVGLSLIEYCQKGECLGEEVIGCNNELKTLQQRKLFLESEISRITGILNKEAGIVANNTTPTTPTFVGDTTADFDVSSRPNIDATGDVDMSASPTNPANTAASNEESACEYTQEEIDDLKGQKDGYQLELDILNGDENTEGSISQKQSECETITGEVTDKNDEIAGNISTECEPITAQITEAEEKLTMLTEGTLSYQRQKDWVNILKNRYQNCVAKQKASQTQYNTIFITQMYDSNEYEGDVSVFGDPEWEKCVELIHECGECDVATEEEETA